MLDGAPLLQPVLREAGGKMLLLLFREAGAVLLQQVHKPGEVLQPLAHREAQSTQALPAL